MANCKYCGKWAGICIHEHLDCERAAKEGGDAVPWPPPSAPPKPLTASGIFWAVFGALWCFSLSAGLVVLFVNLLR